MPRKGAPPIPEPPVSIAAALPPEHLPASDIVSGPWSAFASRQEHMQASHGAEQAPGEDPQAPNSPPASPDSPVLLQLQASSDDEEARQVEEWAQQHASSDSASEAPEERHHLEQLFVCSGPWGSVRSPTPPKASPPTRQSKASRQFVSLRLHAAQSWAPPALQFRVQIHWCPAGAKAAFKQGPILSNRHDPKTVDFQLALCSAFS